MKKVLTEMVIPALTPRTFVVKVEVAAVAPYDTVKALVDQYRSILNVPQSFQTQEELLSELRDIASTLENLPSVLMSDIDACFDRGEPFFPDMSDARSIGIEIDRSISSDG